MSLEQILIAVATAMLVGALLLVIWRGVKGPTRYDRVLAGNLFGTITVVILAVVGLFFHTEFLIDIALIYAMLNFITTIAFLKYIRYQEFGS